MTDRTDAELNAAVAKAMGWRPPKSLDQRGDVMHTWATPDGQRCARPEYLSPAGFFEILAECERRGWWPCISLSPDGVEVNLYRAVDTFEYDGELIDDFVPVAECTFAPGSDLPRALAEAFLEACEAGA